MLGSPRLAFVSGVAAAAAGALLVSGRLAGTALTLAVLALAARAASASTAVDPPGAARAYSRLATTVPAWAAIVAVAALRAGSVQLDDIRGAHAVAGLALARGEPLAVAAAWVAVLAGVLAVAAPLVPPGPAFDEPRAPGPIRLLESLAVALQVAVLVALFGAPQARDARDALPWAAGLAVAGALLLARRTGVRAERAPAVAVILSVLALGLALVGGRL